MTNPSNNTRSAEIGMDWYNNCSAAERARWHAAAGSAVPADTYRAFCEQSTHAAVAGPITEQQAYDMGAKGAPATEAERLLFEAWMRGHCWMVCGTWDGTTYREPGDYLDPKVMTTRQLWAAWRDRAALPAPAQAAPAAVAEPALDARAIAAAVCQRVAELPDRNSPADWPEAMLVTGPELIEIVEGEMAQAMANAVAAPIMPTALHVAAMYWQWLEIMGRLTSFSTFVNEFGYEEKDCKQVYEQVVLPCFALLAAAPQAPAEAQEPYCWHYWNNGGASVYHRGPSKILDADRAAAAEYPKVHHCIPLYTHPAPRQAAPQAPAAPAWADQAVIEYQYTGGTHWCELGPAERMRANFDGVYRLRPGVYPTAAAPAAPVEMSSSFVEWFAKNYPSDTIIVDPAWHAQSIFRMAQAHARLSAVAAPATPVCQTCNDNGAVGNILTAEPCPDCTPAPAAPAVDALDADRWRALESQMDGGRASLIVHHTDAEQWDGRTISDAGELQDYADSLAAQAAAKGAV